MRENQSEAEVHRKSLVFRYHEDKLCLTCFFHRYVKGHFSDTSEVAYFVFDFNRLILSKELIRLTTLKGRVIYARPQTNNIYIQLDDH